MTLMTLHDDVKKLFKITAPPKIHKSPFLRHRATSALTRAKRPTRPQSRNSQQKMLPPTGPRVNTQPPILPLSKPPPRACTCVCHKVFRIDTPTCLQNYLGAIIIAHSGFSPITSQCTDPYCRHPETPFGSLTLYFPPWFLNRALNMVISYASSPEFLVRIPQVLPADHAMFRYARSGNVEGVRSLLASRQATPFDITSNWGQSALRLAVSYNRLEVCKALLAENADPYFADRTHLSAFDVAWDRILGNATTKDNQTQLQGLFSNTAMLDQRGFTRLHKVVLGLLNLDLLPELKESSQIAIDKTDSAGRTALSWAATRGDHDSVKVLLKHHANLQIPSRNGSTPLHWAVQSSSPLAVKLLLEAGAEVNRPNNRGYTPLHFAASKRDDSQVIELLLRFMADRDAKTNHGDTALMNAARANHPNNVIYLMEHGANLDLQNKDGMTALLYALYFNSHQCLRLLLKSNANQALCTKEGSSLLHLAAVYADLQSLEILRSEPPRGQSPSAPRDDGLSPSQLADNRADVSISWKKAFANLSCLVLQASDRDHSYRSDKSDDDEFFDALEDPEEPAGLKDGLSFVIEV
ncbi:ankyrin repeat-containing domain protein [Apiosordaria backusii]|uniref:protein S-acyltransferase n=1 Tax=Apiosordaria backusii TaxID=314023 RepID=A0AA40BSH9_9PEZI|nr:ankyrin repeat-containing domain protein [Apiosordaria backusii]